MSDILLAEYTLKRALRDHTSDLIPTSNPQILCTPLPKHWRSNKSLPGQFRVVSLINIPDGTRVSVNAGNEERPCAELKNPITVMNSNEARFSDLRFLGRSGRGKSFNITITIESTPMLQAVYARAIKVTVDGPRVPRNKYSNIRTVRAQRDHKRAVARHLASLENKRTYRFTGIQTNKHRSECDKIGFNQMANGVDHARTGQGQIHSHPRFPDPACLPLLNEQKSPLASGLYSPSSIESTGYKNPKFNSHYASTERSSTSSDASLPSVNNNTENRIPFSPMESAYLLTTINEAYAKLLARQISFGLENKKMGNAAGHYHEYPRNVLSNPWSNQIGERDNEIAKEQETFQLKNIPTTRTIPNELQHRKFVPSIIPTIPQHPAPSLCLSSTEQLTSILRGDGLFSPINPRHTGLLWRKTQERSSPKEHRHVFNHPLPAPYPQPRAMRSHYQEQANITAAAARTQHALPNFSEIMKPPFPIAQAQTSPNDAPLDQAFCKAFHAMISHLLQPPNSSYSPSDNNCSNANGRNQIQETLDDKTHKQTSTSTKVTPNQERRCQTILSIDRILENKGSQKTEEIGGLSGWLKREEIRSELAMHHKLPNPLSWLNGSRLPSEFSKSLDEHSCRT